MNTVTIGLTGVPSLSDLINHKDTLSWNDAAHALRIHAAVQTMLELHAGLAAARLDEDDQDAVPGLISFLRTGGYRGRRSDCGECPLANAYLDHFKKALKGLRVMSIMVDVSQECISLQAGGSGPYWHLGMSLPASDEQALFISRFDSGSYDRLNAENYVDGKYVKPSDSTEPDDSPYVPDDDPFYTDRLDDEGY